MNCIIKRGGKEVSQMTRLFSSIYSSAAAAAALMGLTAAWLTTLIIWLVLIKQQPDGGDLKVEQQVL